MFSCPGLSRLGRVVRVFSNLSPSINSNVSSIERERDQQKKSDPHIQFDIKIFYLFFFSGCCCFVYEWGKMDSLIEQ